MNTIIAVASVIIWCYCGFKITGEKLKLAYGVAIAILFATGFALEMLNALSLPLSLSLLRTPPALDTGILIGFALMAACVFSLPLIFFIELLANRVKTMQHYLLLLWPVCSILIFG